MVLYYISTFNFFDTHSPLVFFAAIFWDDTTKKNNVMLRCSKGG